MTAIAPSAPVEVVRTVDGIPLKVKLRRAERMRNLKAMGLILPLFAFITFSFVIPIASMLTLGVQNPEFRDNMPRTTEALLAWDAGTGLPGSELLVTFVEEMRVAQAERRIARVGKRLNSDVSGFRSLFRKTGKKLPPPDTPPDQLLQKLIEIDARWGELAYWGVMRKASVRLTPFYMLAAVDRDIDVFGNVTLVPEESRLYIKVLERTFWISFVVTALTLLLGYPIAYLLATLPTKYGNLLLILVLLPFYTSLLVRTTAWVVLLQRQGVINDAAMAIGLYPERAALIYNRFGVYIAMVHILLPFMILPIFSVMKGISPYYMHAAASLGAGPFRSFRKVYFPQTIPGIGAGVLLVFIISLGYYITPALVGGPGDQMISALIAFFVNRTVNWGMAAALSIVLLVSVIVFYGFFNRFVGIDKMRMG